MVQLLDWLGTLPDIVPRLWLKQSDSQLGQRHAGDWVLPPRPVATADLVLARRAWSAFGAVTPEAWFDLRGDPDLGRLPGLHQAIGRTLRELPDSTGLGATARCILALAGTHERCIEAGKPEKDVSDRALPNKDHGLHKLIHRVAQSQERVPSWHHEIGEMICHLAMAPVPALHGPTEAHFDVELHQDPERLRRLHESQIRLTDLGHRLVARRDDWSDHNPVHRWMGGTRLTNDTLWRWDDEAQRLIAP